MTLQSEDNIVNKDIYLELQDETNCKVCYKILDKPVKCKNCDQAICTACKDLMPRNLCPNCKTTFIPGDDLLIRRLLDKIKFKCVWESYGCKDVNNQSNQEQHARNCSSRLENCEYCLQNIPFKDLAAHWTNCTKFRIMCLTCNHTYSREQEHTRIDCIENKVKLLFEMFNFLIRGYDFIFKTSKKFELNQLNYDLNYSEKVKSAADDIHNSYNSISHNFQPKFQKCHQNLSIDKSNARILYNRNELECGWALADPMIQNGSSKRCMIKVLNGSIRFVGIRTNSSKEQQKTNQRSCQGWRKEVSFFTRVADGREAKDTMQISENFSKYCTLIVKVDLEKYFLNIITMDADRKNKKFDEMQINSSDYQILLWLESTSKVKILEFSDIIKDNLIDE